MRTTIFVIFLMAAQTFALGQQVDYNALVQEIAHKLVEEPRSRGIAPYTMPRFRVTLTDKVGINAKADLGTSTIFIGPLLVDILKNDPGELAFVIAHELGHLEDANCFQRGVAQRLSGVALQRMCEASADMIGLKYMMAAGYNPFDAAGAVGRLILLDHNQSSVRGIVLDRFLSDHPVDIDRIRNFGTYTATICQERLEVCKGSH